LRRCIGRGRGPGATRPSGGGAAGRPSGLRRLPGDRAADALPGRTGPDHRDRPSESAQAAPLRRTVQRIGIRMRLSFRLTAAAVAALSALGACAPTVAPMATSAAPLPVAGYDWFLNEDPDEPRLSYGLAQSDDVPLSLMCAPGSGKIGLSLAADRTPQRLAVTLESGGDTETFPARVEEAVIHDGVHLVATAPASHPVF